MFLGHWDSITLWDSTYLHVVPYIRIGTNYTKGHEVMYYYYLLNTISAH